MKYKIPKPELLYTDGEYDHQNGWCDFEQVSQIGDFKVRIDIRSDTKMKDSYARAFVWQKQNGWTLVCQLMRGNMHTPEGIHATSINSPVVFNDDVNELLDRVKKILF